MCEVFSEGCQSTTATKMELCHVAHGPLPHKLLFLLRWEGEQSCRDPEVVFSLAFLRLANQKAGCALTMPQRHPTFHTMGGGWWPSEERLGFQDI